MSSSTVDSSSRNRRNSIEESELPEHEHKRPRLADDTQPNETHVMSDLQQNDGQTAPAVPVKEATDSEERDPTHTPPLPPRTVVNSAVISPTSKVTINTRPLSSQSLSHPTLEVADTEMRTRSQTTESQTVCGDGDKDSTDVADTQLDTAEPLDTISLSSSPSKSPEIEVAEVEDFDQDPTQTRWTGRIGSATAATARSIQPNHVFRTFPFAQEATPGDTHRTISRMADRFQHTGPQDGEIFRQVKNWMTEFVSICDEFPMRLLEEDRDFWLHLPDLVEALLRRETGPSLQARIEDLVDFFVAYAKITKLLIDFDTRNLRCLQPDTDPRVLKNMSFVSLPYLQPLTWLLQVRIPFYEALERTTDLEIAHFLTQVIDRIGDSQSVGLLPSISAFLSELCAMLPQKAEWFKCVLLLLLVTGHVMSPMTTFHSGVSLFKLSAFTMLDRIREDAAEILLKMDNALQQAIVKQSPWLNLETAGKVFEQLGPMMGAIAIEIPSIGRDIISTAGVGFADSDLTDLPRTMPHAWKFKTLRKFVTHGRMELRVYGVEVMSSDLVQVYKDHITTKTSPATADPLVRFLVKFIKENQFIDYIVGVDSHPQLIHRSHNVVGFLCVSGTYTDADTDTIWKTIVESQDPRTVHEVFTLQQMCFNVSDLPTLHYICQKLYGYPLQRIDMHVLQFIVTLFDHIRNHVRAPSSGATDPITRQLCVRLFREASMEENLSLEQAVAIRRDFPPQFSNVLSLGRAEPSTVSIGDEELNQMLSEAAENLKAHTQHASGDLVVLTCLFPMLRRDVLLDVVRKFDLTALLIAEFAHILKQYDLAIQQDTSLSAFEVAYDFRSSFLYYLLLLVPETFSDELVETLWTSYLGAKQLSASIRGRAWATLTHVMRTKQVRDDNLVLDLIIDKHVQSLGAQDYSDRVLEFLKMSVPYTIRRSPQALDVEDVAVIPGIDRIWKVMLEAPPNTVENEATDFIIRQYLDNQLVTRRSKPVIEATHSSLVDRCVRQVIASASKLKSYTDGIVSGEDEPMVIIATQDEIRAEELRFDRSLLFLRRFLEGMKLRPRYSPAPQAQNLPDFADKKGEALDLTIQISGSKYVSGDMQKITFGTENTGDELWKYISDASGFTQFSVYHFGQKTTLAGQTTTLAELKASAGLLMVHKTANSPESVPTRSARAASPVATKIMHHFDDLYDLLDADERLSKEVYSFLSLFSAQTEIVRIVRSRERSPAELLPPGKPFKLLYSARALRCCIEDESFCSTPDSQFLVYSIQTIVAILPELDLTNPADALQLSTAYALIEALLLAFRAKVPAETSRTYIQDRAAFAIQISRLLRFTLGSNESSPDEISTSVMVKLTLETFIEACLHDERIWGDVDGSQNFQDLIMGAFVTDPRVEVRHSLLEVVVGLTGAAGTKLHLKINNPRAPRSRFQPAAIETCLSHLWTALVEILPHACQKPEHCTEICETMLAVLRRIGKSFPAETLRRYFDQWSALLLRHEHVEIVGQPLRDHVVACLTKLLLECCKLLKSMNSLPLSNWLIDEIISLFLFPSLSDARAAVGDGLTLPVLDGAVRNNLYSLVLVLCQGPQDMATVITKMTDDLLPKDFFEPPFAHDRQSLRSEVGYAGLRNLSNTCYLNSLLTQLFMNVRFREFFLSAPYTNDPQQKLVPELAKVFAYMQNSFEKSIDPSGAVDAITTYEGEQIDVSVQMDVDEFFNLLFDRLEGQIDQRSRNFFRSIYGGQLVQQVKSKECEHISERLEPFSAVQVEIKGKARLEDSLRAYVEGEVLQGENKYSCTSCGRHVDAVKRACLKDIPDNLIFNLKRFDYDIMTGMRAKVNDEFQFPDSLDMAPYTLARLSDEEQPEEPDHFQLVGVIVHSGTADSGHYYSFIRQRPSVKAVKDSWVQFNDQDVTFFDPSQMRDNCFGGTSDAGFYNLPKFYSAYMLFYQRTSSIQAIEQQYRQHDVVNPVRIALPLPVEQHITQQNELFLRSYCVQDSSHALFVCQLLERMGQGTGKCSEEHTLETGMIEMVLEYVRQISSRWKELPSFDDTMKVLAQYSEKCPECASTIARWFSSPRVLEDVIVRSPYQAVRKGFGNLFAIVFNQLHAAKMVVDAGEGDYFHLPAEYSQCLQKCVTQLAKLWDVVTKSGRCWSEYFGVLACIQRLGDDETTLLLDEEFLEKCIDIVLVHLNDRDFPINARLRTRYSVYLAAREKNRPFNHAALIQLLVSLVLRVNLHHMPDGDYRVSDKKIGLTPSELDVLGLGRMPANFEWIRRLIAGRMNALAADSLVEYLAQDRLLAGSLSDILLKGLNDRMITTAVSFIRPVLIFSHNCHFENQIVDLVQAALDSIATVGVEYGRDYFEFVDALLKLDNHFIDADVGFLEEQVTQAIPHWAPTFLLTPVDGQINIRNPTVDLLRRLLFDPLQEAELQDARAFRALRGVVQELASSCQSFAHTTFLTSRSRETIQVQPGQISQFIDVVEHCLLFFDIRNAADEEKVGEIKATVAALRAKAENAIETLSSGDWQENSSEMAELSAEDYDDPLSP